MPINIFKKLSQVPRPSGKEENIVEFIKRFAKENNCEYKTDQFNNILLSKKTSNSGTLILQAHTDMVCVSQPGHNIDFETQGIEVIEENGFLKANKTSLGADNGIGVAMALALLQENFPMNVQVLLTSEEETTMNGAKNFNTSWLKGKHMLSLDGSVEKTIDVSSASSTTLEVDLGTVKKFALLDSAAAKNLFGLEISGLSGGHSGVDVDKNLGHAFKILLDFLHLIGQADVISLQAKTKSNQIATHCNIVFATDKTKEQLNLILKDFYVKTFNSYNAPGLKINLKTVSKSLDNPKAYLNWQAIFKFLNNLEFGVIKENKNFDVTLSSNIYEIDLENARIKLHIRANEQALSDDYITKVNKAASALGFSVKQTGFSPGFKAQENSRLIALASNACKQVYGQEPKINNIHAGVECGVFAQKMPKLDVCVIGANIENMHSTKERVEIASVEKTYLWLKEIVKNFK